MNVKQLSEMRNDGLIEGGLVECTNCGMQKRYVLVVNVEEHARLHQRLPKIDLEYIDENARCCKKPFYMWKDY